MTALKMPSLADLRDQFSADNAEKASGELPKTHPKLIYDHVELTVYIYVNGVLQVLKALNQKEDEILHVNDNTTISDFNIEGNTLAELSELCGFKVEPSTYLWEAGRGVGKLVPKYRPLYN